MTGNCLIPDLRQRKWQKHHLAFCSKETRSRTQLIPSVVFLHFNLYYSGNERPCQELGPPLSRKNARGEAARTSEPLCYSSPVFFSEGHSVDGISGGQWTSDGPGTAATCKDLTALLSNNQCGLLDKGWGGRKMQMYQGSSPLGRKQDPWLIVLVFYRNSLPFPQTPLYFTGSIITLA